MNKKYYRIPLLILAAAAVGVRFLGAWWYARSGNPDYGIVVLMARHIAKGIGWPVFFYGQPYMGSLEPTFSALLMKIFGMHPFVTCLGTALIGLVVLVVVYRWAKELSGSWWGGFLAVLLAAVGPYAHFHYMASPRGGYALGVLLTVLLLREGARAAREAVAEGEVSLVRAWRLGLCAGLGFWNFWLTLPAAGAAATLICLALRRDILRVKPVIWLAGGGCFLVGSLPFWVWNAANGWQSFGMGRTGGPRQFLGNIKLLLVERFPLLIDAHGVGAARSVAVFVSLVVLSALIVALFRPRVGSERDLRSWSLLGAFIYAALFVVAYGGSSFCVARTPRYLVPFVPVFAVFAGAAVAVAGSGGSSSDGAGNRRYAKRALAAFVYLSIGVLLVNQWRMLPLHPGGRVWGDGPGQLADTLTKEGADVAMADFVLHGLNWASDERLCVSSPISERYAPFAEKLERSLSPAVLENFRGFNHFLLSTGATADYRRLGGLRVHSGANPPGKAVDVVPADKILSIRDSDWRDLTSRLTDYYRGTSFTIKPAAGRDVVLEAAFSVPTRVCGVRAWVDGREGYLEWSVEGRSGADAQFERVSEPHVLTGYFWSGQRFYFSETLWGAEKRFEPGVFETVRLVFSARGDAAAYRISELQFLVELEEAEALDVEGLAEALLANSVRRVYAERYTANLLDEVFAGRVWVGLEPSFYGQENSAAELRLLRGTAIVAEPDALESIRVSLGRMGLEPREMDFSGRMIFFFDSVPDVVAGYEGLCFGGRLLQHKDPEILASYLSDSAPAGSVR